MRCIICLITVGGYIIGAPKMRNINFPITAINLKRVIKKMTDTKKYAKKIKSDNYTSSYREKSDITIALLE